MVSIRVKVEDQRADPQEVCSSDEVPNQDYENATHHAINNDDFNPNQNTPVDKDEDEKG